MQHTTIAVDLAKSVFQVAVSHQPGQVHAERRLSRERFREYMTKQPPATVVMEACGSAHYWGRQLQSLGHTVRLLPAHDAHRYVRRNKTDRTDTKGLLEANRNEEIYPVPVKTVEQQSITALHRLRSTWMATRTRRLNTLRGLLREFGLIIPVGASHVVPVVRELLASSPHLPGLVQTSVGHACDEITTLEAHIRAIERQLETLAQERDDVTLLQTIPGIGLLSSTALVALVGDIHRFASSRAFASFLGLTPKEDSSAGRRQLGAISKHGDVYLRTLLTHGARSVLVRAHAVGEPTAFQRWARETQRRRGHNVATVAVANKLARIVWAVWTHQRPFVADPPPAVSVVAGRTTSSHPEDCIEDN